MNADAGSLVAANTWQSSSVAADRRSLAQGLLLFVTYFALYGATLVDAIAPLPIAVNILFAIGNGICIAMLFIIGHDCGHSALVPGRRWNLWLGRICFIAVVHSLSLWRLVHNRHHRRTNLKGADPVWAPMSIAEYRSASSFRQWLERVYRSPFGPVIYYYIEIWVPLLLVPLSREARAHWRRHLPDTLFVLTGFAVTIAVIVWLGERLTPTRPLWLVLLLGWVIPFAVWNYFAAVTIYLNHTHPEIPWFGEEKDWSFHNATVRGTVHVKIPLDILPLYGDVMAHPAHHAKTSRPVYTLPAEQEALKAHFGSEVKEYTLSLAECRRIYAACKLFDFERMCWTDFDGTPTGPCLRS
jgi:omega-6 fatty acid desaturase (delta-12 desaturase)